MDDMSLSPLSLASSTSASEGKRPKATPGHPLFDSPYILQIVLKFFSLEEGCKLQRVNHALKQVVTERPEVHIKLDPSMTIDRAATFLISTTKCYIR